MSSGSVKSILATMIDGATSVSPTIECGSPESVIIDGHGNNGENDGEGMPGPTLAVGRPADLIIQLRNLHLIHLTTNLNTPSVAV